MRICLIGVNSLYLSKRSVRRLWFLLAGSENHCLRFGTVLLHCQAGPEGVRTYRLDTNTVQISGKWQQYVQFVYHPTVVAIAHGTENRNRRTLPPREVCACLLDRGAVHDGCPRRDHSIGVFKAESIFNERSTRER